MKLPPQLEPHKLKKPAPNDSVFIYSPLNLARKNSRAQSITEYGKSLAKQSLQDYCFFIFTTFIHVCRQLIVRRLDVYDMI